ncbi:MAG: hypothetical protein KDB20_00005, partial [Microthrixaceae bacterium]|nr:hypothetical protein [Microthrixaceae bacterium]
MAARSRFALFRIVSADEYGRSGVGSGASVSGFGCLGASLSGVAFSVIHMFEGFDTDLNSLGSGIDDV